MFFGNKKIVSFLELQLERKKISRAYLFSGPEHLGKFDLALDFSQAVVSGKPLWRLNEMEKKQSNLDIIILEPIQEEKRGSVKEKKIGIEDIRKAKSQLATYPYLGKMKVLIVNRAEKMTPESQNALLKMLEEPNSTTLTILVSSDPTKIISTLRSRCQKVNFKILSKEELEEILDNCNVNSSIRQEITLLSFKRPGLILDMVKKPKALVQKRESLVRLQEISSMSLNEKINLAEKMIKNIPETIEILNLFSWFIHSQKRVNYNLLFELNRSVEKIKETNSNHRLVLENLFIQIKPDVF